MAKLIVSILSSLDGYCAGQGGTLDKMPMDAAFDTHNLGLMRDADTFVFGATTYSLFQSYWPNVDRGPQAEPVDRGPQAEPVAREISQRFETGKKVVVSDSLASAMNGPWAETEIVSQAAAVARIADLKRHPGANILIFGSARLTSFLLSRGLVDDLYLLVANVTLGGGVRTFEPGLAVGLRLLHQGRLPNSDIAALLYAANGEPVV